VAGERSAGVREPPRLLAVREFERLVAVRELARLLVVRERLLALRVDGFRAAGMADSNLER
jgi:hypothetical protein